jgi:type III pantothenate kinase
MTDLLIDCGNTRLKWRLQEQGVVQRSGVMLVRDINLTQLQACLPDEVGALYWASVAVVEIGLCLEAWAQQKNIPCQQMTTQYQWQDLRNGYEQPKQLGVDRWLAMIAARQHTRRAVCIVDCGSAITFDYVSAEGQHEGSYIMPGTKLMRQALVHDTTEPGTATGPAVSAGCQQMVHYGVGGLIKDAQASGYEILLCGGDAMAIAGELDLPYLEELVLDGLARVAGLVKH